ncbi:MAG: sulfite exporter TauE/SafE family protein [Parvibaculum sp.]|uniref:sulfite exporter TauE/SafE family protein n=1 Tax=Parvibaculum sp. TaxID=2024848 RepID=UPI001DE2FA92|nr:sulfite exporter TauE/SafE family protein [Parvibaculum sp.]MBX3490226.1 sulfite exporter TauE/SafE family protein [Parvibaculum sp.]MBX3495211.1 sulfite exporter TauE/SafE family protein [Parvibaculum sp.]MCW5729093.1 sulfite exporter TauE/SafE family protein [Parvibaculum sp.]
MQIYLPIAEMPVSVLTILAMGVAIGFLSGMFGVGGGFLMTPLLIFLGIPPAVAVGTQTTQVVASSVTGALAHFTRKSIDFKMGAVLLAGGVAGSISGIFLFKALSRMGQIDLVISLVYVVFLSVIGAMMMVESVRAIRAARGGALPARRGGHHNWIHGLPFKMRFRRSKLYISVIPPILVGYFVGTLSAIMGVGGGFIMIPAMIYLLRMPTNVVIGTSFFQIVFVTALTGVMHAYTNFAVDIVLGFLLVIGGVVGAQYGVRAAERLPAEQLRALLAAILLLISLRLGYELVTTPADLYSVVDVVPHR